MSLAIVGDGASYEFRWRRWALLTDTVVAHCENGVAGSVSPQLHAVGNALGSGTVRLPAAELAAEIRKVREALRGLPLEALMMSRRTATVIYRHDVPSDRPLTPHEMTQVTAPGTSKDLAEYFATMLDSFEDVCAKPTADGYIEVFDG